MFQIFSGNVWSIFYRFVYLLLSLPSPADLSIPNTSGLFAWINVSASLKSRSKIISDFLFEKKKKLIKSQFIKY